MPRKSAKSLVSPKAYTELMRLDEANVGRLGLISIQERIPDDYTSWTVDFLVEGRPARLTCESVPRYGGVPHGLDGDIASAIILMFHEQECPPDGVIRTTAYQLLKRAGLDASGRYYKALKLSLFRLRTATYFASEAWREHPKGNWTTVTFNYLEGLEFTSQHEEQELGSASSILIRLAKPIVRSIRAEYVKPLDVEFLTSLNRPLTRALYRLLDARRFDPNQPNIPHPVYTVNVSEWGEACKIVDPRTNKIRFTLKGAHEELIERGYLKDVEYVGRGKKQVMNYIFADFQTSAKRPVTPLVQQLLDAKVSLAGAWKLVDEFGEERVSQRLERYRQLVARGYQAKNKSGLLVDIIRDNEGKYGDDEPSHPDVKAESTGTAAAGKPAYMPTLMEAAEQPLSLEERVERAMKTMQFLLRERLSTREYALLRACLIVERPEPEHAAKLVSQAKAHGQLDQVTDELLKYIVTAPGAE